MTVRSSLIVAAAQMGPVEPGESRREVVERCIASMEQAAKAGAALVVFPEAALTPFFPHWLIEDERELDDYFEQVLPNPDVASLFEAARKLGVGFHLGYCELDVSGDRKRRFNSAVLVDRDGTIVGKYRKIHLPGYAEPRPEEPFQNLEKRYFEVGDLGFRSFDAFGTRIGILICNDRRWAESYRVLALQGAAIVLIGYNTPRHHPKLPESDRLAEFHNHLSMQAGAYQNALWVVGVAKAGVEAGVEQIGGSCFIAPSGEICARSTTAGDELVVHAVDLDLVARYRRHVFDFSAHRQPQHYRAIVD